MRGLYGQVVLTGIVVLSFAGPALAQAEQGDKEISLNGDVTTAWGGGPESESVTVGTIGAGLGYYFTERWQGFGSFNVAFVNTATSGTEVDAGIGLGARYHFTKPDVKAVPYLGFDYSLGSFRNPGESSFIQPNGGLKYYIRPKVAIDFNFSYGRAVFADNPYNVIRESVGLVFGF